MRTPKLLSVLVLLCAPWIAGAQNANAVANVNGRTVAVEELREIFRGVPPDVLQYAAQSPKDFLERYFLVVKLAALAEKEGLDKKSPYKDRLDWSRLQYLSRAAIDKIAKDAEPSIEEREKFYDDNAASYRNAKVKLIYLAFAEEGEQDGEASLPSEADARKKAETILAGAKAGADFVALVRKHSDDDESKEKDGDFPDVTADSQLPDDVKSAILGAGTGDLVGPLRQPSGFYVFKVVSAETRPFEQVSDQIREQLQTKRMDERMQSLRAQVSVEVKNQDFFRAQMNPSDAQSVEPGAVVAAVNGQPITAEEMNGIFRGGSPQIRQNAAQSPEGFLQQLGIMRQLTGIAEKEGLAAHTPNRERLRWNNAEVLRQAMLDEKMNTVVVTAEEQRQAYESTRDQWREATAKVLYMAASPNLPFQVEGVERKDPEEVRAKLAAIKQQIKNEEDFVRMVKVYSEDEETKNKDGDWGVTVRPNDQRIPEHVRQAILAAKPGEMTEVIEEKNGFYLFLVKTNEIMSYEQVRSDVYRQEQQNRFNEWLQAEMKSIQVESLDAETFRATLPRP